MTYQREKVKERQVTIPTTQTQALGIVTNIPMGIWSATTQYKKLNIVRSHNASYMAIKDNIGVEPTITQGWQEVWQVMAYDGGAVSPDGNYPSMNVGQATNDSEGNNIANQFNSIREDIQNEAHFRGYLATNAEIQALSATPNDYAYSAESGTVWIYQTETGWTNSGKPVPDQTTPASNTLPLMDGTASIGTSNAYARGDHRHPENENKVDKTQIVQELGESETNIMSQKAVTQQLNALKALYNNHPIVIRFDDISPASIVGGTWVLIKNRVLLGAGDKYSLGTIGGSEDAVVVEHGTHLYNFDWLPSGNLVGKYLFTETLTNFGTQARGWNTQYGGEVYPAGHNVGESGTGKNMMPFLAVNIWVRDDDNSLGGLL